jgi:hypothetical protein
MRRTRTLQDMAFVFLCLDSGRLKVPIIEKLEELGISVTDVGMGLHVIDDLLVGVL